MFSHFPVRTEADWPKELRENMTNLPSSSASTKGF